VLYGNSNLFSATQTFTAPLAGSNATTKSITDNWNMVSLNDLAVVSGNAVGPAADCRLIQISAKANVDGRTVNHVGLRYNDPAGTGATLVSGGDLNNLGPGPRMAIWQIRKSAATSATATILAWSEDIGASGTWNEVAEGVVDLQAEYGVDGDNDNQISAAEWTTAAPANWTKVRAVRLAMLARSQQFEKDIVTPATPTWSGSATSPFVMMNLDNTAGTTTPADPTVHWQHYRYRVYEQVIPLRNVIWGTAP
jgi:type IV pilus assembly protein PilW